jgi:hypothetical protein
MAGPSEDAVAAFGRRLQTAADRLFTVALVDDDRYRTAATIVGNASRRFDEQYQTLDQLMESAPVARLVVIEVAADARLDTHGLDVDVMAEAAMAMTFRKLFAASMFDSRERALAEARERGDEWATVEEPGDMAWHSGSMRWVDVHLRTGTTIVRSITTDAGTGELSYHVELRPVSGAAQEQQFTSREDWIHAVDHARSNVGS